jgi:hypothetical protein
VTSLARASRPLALALLLAASPGCKNRAGSACKPGESACRDKTTALVCRAEKLAEVACKGPLGCGKLQGQASCDTSVASAGDACMGDREDEHACTPDRTRALVCKEGTFAPHLECRGKGGCAIAAARVSCDMSIAAAGDRCTERGAVACAVDGKQMLVCQNGRFALHRHCRGQLGCQLKDDAPTCDQTLSVEGEPCALPGYVVCSVDGKEELVCQGGRFQRARSCRTTGCVVTNRAGRAIECR